MSSRLHHFFEANRHRLPLFIPVAVGGGAAAYFGLLTEPVLWPYVLVLSAIIGLAYAARRNLGLFYASIFIIAGLIGFVNASIQTHRLHSPVLAKPVFWKQVSGHVEGIALDEGSVKITLSKPIIDTVAKENTPHELRITLKKIPEPMLAVGDEISIKATLFPLPEPVAPGAFDFGRYLYFQGLGAVGYSTQFPEVTYHAATTSNLIDQFRLEFASDIIKRMEPPFGAVAAAITVGEQKAVPDAVNESLRDSGLYHILSISGLHMAIAAGLMFLSIRFLLALWPYAALHFSIKKIAATLALLSSFFYLLAAGAPVPAIRSFIMVAVVFTAILADRKGISMVSLAWAALIILLVQPDSIISASFQLSFAATAAIIVLYERYGSMLYRPNAGIAKRLMVAVLATMMVSIVATLATAPFVITHFNRLQLWGMIANALVSPLTAFLIMPSVVFSFLLWPFGLQGIAYVPLEYGMKIMLWIGENVAHLPFASIYLPSMSAIGFIAAFFGLYVFLLLKTRVRFAGLALIAIGFVSMLFVTEPDVLIADNAKLIAVKDAKGNLVMLKGGNASFTSGQWAKSQGQEATLALSDASWDADTHAECDKEACTYTRGSITTLFIFNPRATKHLCEKISPEVMVFRFTLYEGECTDVADVIDRKRLRMAGSIDIRFEQGVAKIRHASDLQGTRPWVAQALQ